MLFTGRANPWPSSGATRYSTGNPLSRRAITIWSDSALFTRGSLAPCTTISGVLILAAEFSGDCRCNCALPSGAPGSPTRWQNILRTGSQYGGIESGRAITLEGPTIDTAAAYKPGVNTTPASVA